MHTSIMTDSAAELQRVARWFAVVGPRANRWVLLGARCLEYWGNRFACSSPSTTDAGLGLEDFAVWGPSGASQAFAAALGGEHVTNYREEVGGVDRAERVRFAEGTGVSVVNFVRQVRSVPTNILRTTRVEVTRAESGVAVHAMHPVHLLGALVQEVSASNRMDNTLAIQRIQLAIHCARAYILEQLAEGRIQEVIRLNQAVHQYSVSDSGLALTSRYDVPVINALVVDERLPAEFVNERYPAMLVHLSERLRMRGRQQRKPGVTAAGIPEGELYTVRSMLVRNGRFAMELRTADGRTIEHPAFRTRGVRVGDTVRLLANGTMQIAGRARVNGR